MTADERDHRAAGAEGPIQTAIGVVARGSELWVAIDKARGSHCHKLAIRLDGEGLSTVVALDAEISDLEIRENPAAEAKVLIGSAVGVVARQGEVLRDEA